MLHSCMILQNVCISSKFTLEQNLILIFNIYMIIESKLSTKKITTM